MKKVLEVLGMIIGWVKRFVVIQKGDSEDLNESESMASYDLIMSLRDKFYNGVYEAGEIVCCDKETSIKWLIEFLQFTDMVRLGFLNNLSYAFTPSAKRRLSAALMDISNVQDDIESVLLKNGIRHTEVIHPVPDLGLVRYWKMLEIYKKQKKLQNNINSDLVVVDVDEF